jgi:hypothetical protein
MFIIYKSSLLYTMLRSNGRLLDLVMDKKAGIIARLISNPLLVKEIRRSPKALVRPALKAGFAMGVVMMVLSLLMLFASDEVGHITLIMALYGLVVISLPSLAANSASTFTLNIMQNAQFDLLYLTSISNAQLIEGYILTTLYRCRGYFSVVLGFAPFALIGGIYLSVYEPYVRCLNYRFNPYPCDPPSLLPSAPLALVAFVLLGVCIVGVCLLLTSLGVLLATLWRTKFFSGMAALILALIASSTLILALINHRDTFELFQSTLIYLPFPFLLCLLVIRIARPFARRPA